MPILALTATATPTVQDEIVRNLCMGSAQRPARRFIMEFMRENLFFAARRRMGSGRDEVVKLLCARKQGAGAGLAAPAVGGRAPVPHGPTIGTRLALS